MNMKKNLALLLSLLPAVPAYAIDLAKVNGRVITDKDVKAALGSFNDGQRRQILEDKNSKKQVVANLIERELMMQEAEKQKLDKDAEYQEAMEQFKRQFLTRKLVEKNVGPKVTNSAAKKYYELNKRRYSTDKVQVQHILVQDEKAAQDILKKAAAPGADFQKLAEEFSKDPSAKNNRGDLGVITRDSPLVDEFKEAAFGGKVGEVVGPVKTMYGYHLIKIVDKKVGKVLNYDEVELQVKNDLRTDLVNDYVVQLRKQAAVTVDDKAVGKL